MVLEVPVPVRFRDLDAMGHVNNAVVFTYLEQARSEYFFQLIGHREVASLGFILARAECNFETPIALGDEVVVRLWPSRVGKSSFALDYEVLEKGMGTRLATARSVQVRYDYAKRSKVDIEDGLRKTLERDLKAPGDW